MNGLKTTRLSRCFLVLLTMRTSRMFTHACLEKVCHEPANHTDVISSAIHTFYTSSTFVHRMTESIKQQTESILSSPDRELTLDTKNEESDSSCPWKWRMNIDQNRIPAVIYFAECACAYCQRQSVDECSESLGIYGKCRPVYGPMLVVKRFCDEHNGFFSYKAELQNIARGCTCERRTV